MNYLIAFGIIALCLTSFALGAFVGVYGGRKNGRF